MGDIIAKRTSTMQHVDMTRGKKTLVNVTRVIRYKHNKYSPAFNALQQQLDDQKRKYAGRDPKTFKHVGLVVDESVQNEGADDGIKA